jgi:phosphoglycerate dehydrogenase-like enzyme
VVLIWVPLEPVAQALAGLDGATVEVVVPDVTALPRSAAEMEFYVPPFFPAPPAVAAMAQLPWLKVVQTMTAGFDLVRSHMPDGAVLCNARGVDDASTAEWVVAAILASVRQFQFFAAEQAAGRWSYRFTDCLAGKTVLVVGYGSIGHAVERRLAGFDVQVHRVAKSARDGVNPVSALPELLPEADVVAHTVVTELRWASTSCSMATQRQQISSLRRDRPERSPARDSREGSSHAASRSRPPWLAEPGQLFLAGLGSRRIRCG